jgi:diguanylate cyclase (GGDEF)-like protein/PAS domain S-box-containing protein
MDKVRILIVENERIVSMDMQRRLRSLSYDVVGAAVSGDEAIQKAEAHRPDLVLMDIMLDGPMDGIQAAEIIRSRFGIPVIYLTAYGDGPTLERAKVTEPFGYILKPFEERELHGHIEIALYKHRMEKRLKDSEERYVLATRGANDGLWDWDLRTNKIYFSPRWTSMLGYKDDAIKQNPKEWFTRLHPEDSARVKRQIAAHIKGQSSHFESEYRILCQDGSYRWMLTRGLALRDGVGKAHRMAGSQTDITERKVYDPLTGLPNRTLFIDRIQSAVERKRRHPEQCFTVLSVGVNDLPVISGLGHALKDQLLSQIARSLTEALQPGDTVASLSDDNFGVLLSEIHNATDATHIAAAIVNRMSQPFHANGRDIYVNTSIGIAVSTNSYQSAEDLLRDAHTAMHRAKISGKSQFEIFDEKMRACVAGRVQRETDLRRAIERGDFQVHYQPIVSLSDGTIAGFEALVRWRHHDGLLLPGEFIPLAEQTGLIIPIERYVLRRAMEQMREWDKMRLRSPLTMSVNLSAQHYSERDLVDEVVKMLKATGFDSRFLKLEITETALMHNTEVVSSTLARLNDLHIQLAMDDFGTGYSSLSYLHQFPIKTLKIDRSFVQNLGLKSETRKIVQTIVALGNHLGMDVTAEGVENAEQIAELQAFDCSHAQGFLFSKPLAEDAAGALLQREVPWLQKAREAMQAILQY